MSAHSATLAAILSFSLFLGTMPIAGAPPAPIGILTQASNAHLDDNAASPGLSVFAGECLQTDSTGRAALRCGRSSLGLLGSSEVVLVRISDGVHADLATGALRFSTTVSQMIEVHAEDAIIRSSGAPTDATVSIVQAKVLQIDARHGNLAFSYRSEFRNLPEGQIYRIYLDSPEPSETDAAASAVPGGGTNEVVYYIVGVAAAGAITWLTYDAIHSANQPVSPAKP